VKYVHCVITVDNALNCVIKYLVFAKQCQGYKIKEGIGREWGMHGRF